MSIPASVCVKLLVDRNEIISCFLADCSQDAGSHAGGSGSISGSVCDWWCKWNVQSHWLTLGMMSDPKDTPGLKLSLVFSILRCHCRIFAQKSCLKVWPNKQQRWWMIFIWFYPTHIQVVYSLLWPQKAPLYSRLPTLCGLAVWSDGGGCQLSGTRLGQPNWSREVGGEGQLGLCLADIKSFWRCT